MKNKLFSSVLLSFGLGLSASAADPVITLSKTSVDATSSDQTIAFTTSPANAYIQIKFLQNPPNGVASLYGTAYDASPIFIPKGTYPGTWILSEVIWSDDGGTSKVYTRTPTKSWEIPLTSEMESVSFNVSNTNRDTVPPAVTSFNIDLDKLEKSASGYYLYAPCTVTATDDKSGFEGLIGVFVGNHTTLDIGTFSGWTQTGTNTFKTDVTFSNAQPGENLSLKEIGYADRAGNAVYHSISVEPYTLNNYTVNRTEPIPQIFNVIIELPDNFNNIPLRSSGSAGSSGGGVASSSSSQGSSEVKKSKKKGKKGKSSAKKSNGGSSKKSAASKSSSGKKAGGKKSKKR